MLGTGRDVVSIDDVFRRRGGGRHHHAGLSNPGAVWHDAATDRPTDRK